MSQPTSFTQKRVSNILVTLEEAPKKWKKLNSSEFSSPRTTTRLASRNFSQNALFEIKYLKDLRKSLSLGLSPFLKNSEGQSILQDLMLRRSMTQIFDKPFPREASSTLKRRNATLGSEVNEAQIRSMFLHLAKSYPKLLEEFISFFNVSMIEDQITIFQFACYYHQVDLFDLSKESFVSKTALKITAFGLLFLQKQAKKQPKQEQIEKALFLGVDPNENHFGTKIITPLHMSILHFDLNVAYTLLLHGHDVSPIDYYGNTPIQVIECCLREKFKKKYKEEQGQFAFGIEHKKQLYQIAKLLIQAGARLSPEFKRSKGGEEKDRGALIHFEHAYIQQLNAIKKAAFPFLKTSFKEILPLTRLIFSYL